MQFNFIWDSSVSSAPAAFQSAVIAAGQTLGSYIDNPITINVQIGWGENAGTPVTTGKFAALSESHGITYTFAQIRTALTGLATSGDDQTSVAWLQQQPVPVGTDPYYVNRAQEKLFGVLSGTDPGVDASIGFSSTAAFGFNPAAGIAAGQTDLTGIALGQLTLALGRIAGHSSGLYQPLDLFRFSAPNTLQPTQGQPAYFSVDGGNTHLNNYETVSSTGSFWVTTDPTDVLNFSSTAGVVQVLTPTDLRQMDVLGYHLSAAGNAFAHTINDIIPGDTIVGTANADIINALGGNDTITGGPGNDTITGGSGINTSVYTGAATNYTATVTAGAPAYTVQDRVGTDGTDTLTNIQNVQFTDQTLNTSWVTQAANLPTAQFAPLIELYIASFNRAPDAVGLDYWAAQFSGGMSLSQIAASFFVQPETVAAYPVGQSTQTFVNPVYQNVLGRQADTGGLNYWVGQLQSGAVAQNNFLLAIINGALAPTGGSTDAQYLTNKELVGGHFALTQGLSDPAWAKTVMAGVNATAASVTTANQVADSFAATAATASSPELVVKILGIVA